MTRCATAAEQAEITRLGVELLERADVFLTPLLPVGASDEQRSQEAGRLLLLAIFAAGNDLAWLSRPHLVSGVGVAIGTVMAQWPHVAQGVWNFLTTGAEAGYAEARKALEPKGSA